MKSLLMTAVAMIVVGSAYAGTPPPTTIPTVQVYDFKSSIKNSNVGRGTDRKTNQLYDYKFSELNTLAGYLAVPDCTDCGYGSGQATLFVYRLGDSDRRLFRVQTTLNLVDVFATRADASGTVLGKEVEGFLTINPQGAGLTASTEVIFLSKGMNGFFNDTAGGSLAPYLDMGNTKFWAAGFGRVSQGKGYYETIPNPDPCFPPKEIWIPGCLTLESLCGQIVGLMEYDYICAPPYSVLCAALVECVNDTHNAIAGGSWQIRRNAKMESVNMFDVEQKILDKLPNFTPFNWLPMDDAI
jgi:hypothetical protein